MSPGKKPTPSENKSISISGDVKDSAVIIGDNNTVNQTIIQKFFNIFKSDSETLEQRNRRILLGHVENAWIKGVLDASLHGAALLALGIKQDPEAVTKYPWAIKKESTDETLPAGLSMLEIFDSIGMGRSLLILGAPGSGKTTMLLELARQLIARAREDVTQPIPMVFNLSSWTESKTLADWLAQELNNLYSVPRKTAPDWVKGNKLLLLLDGLDEVRPESRAKCVEAINEFRKQNGLTSLAVCSRSQDYEELNAKLSFEGAIEVQPLSQKQISEYFKCFGKEIQGIKRVLKRDNTLLEMAVSPFFLNIIVFAYRESKSIDILVSKNKEFQRKHIFETYIARMFEHSERSKRTRFKKQDVFRWLSWLARKMIEHNQTPYFIERMQPRWLNRKNDRIDLSLIVGLISGLVVWLLGGLPGWLVGGWGDAMLTGLLVIVLVGLNTNIQTVDSLVWKSSENRGLFLLLLIWPFAGLLYGLFDELHGRMNGGIIGGLAGGIAFGLSPWLLAILFEGLESKQIYQTKYPGEKLSNSAKNSLYLALLIGGSVGLILGLISGLSIGLYFGSLLGLIAGLKYGGLTLVNHYNLRLQLSLKNLGPWMLVPFLDHCVDLIFLRRVGGGYIFVHRLLMEHFAEMYVESPRSKGN